MAALPEPTVRSSVRALIEGSDLVIAVGTELGETDSWTSFLTFSGKLIRIDLDAHTLTRDYAPAIGLLADFTQAFPNEQPPRMLLANLLVQRSTRHQIVDRASAVADLELALKFNPALESARLRLRQLRGDGRP